MNSSPTVEERNNRDRSMVPSEMLFESIDANAAFSIRLISGKPLKQLRAAIRTGVCASTVSRSGVNASGPWIAKENSCFSGYRRRWYWPTSGMQSRRVVRLGLKTHHTYHTSWLLIHHLVAYNCASCLEFPFLVGSSPSKLSVTALSLSSSCSRVPSLHLNFSKTTTHHACLHHDPCGSPSLRSAWSTGR